MDLELAGQPCTSRLCQGVPPCVPSLDLLFKVRSIRLVGIVLSMFCLVEKVPFIR